MCEPVSITCGVAALLGACYKVVVEARSFMSDAEAAESRIGDLIQDVENLQRVLESMKATLENTRTGTRFQATGHIGTHWRNLSQSLTDGNSLLMELVELLETVNGNSNVLKTPRKLIRLKSAADQIAHYQQRVRNFQETLHLSLQTIVLYALTYLQTLHSFSSLLNC